MEYEVQQTLRKSPASSDDPLRANGPNAIEGRATAEKGRDETAWSLRDPNKNNSTIENKMDTGKENRD
ncbi:hypothetical protein NQZ68_025935 [Dissostichus eleginoides]|nr:hypothetical protein NQZ68_025935 [Dissostichus eleginoides]